MPDKTKDEFDEEGFFHTGDIGQFTADGVLQIVDRKKNLVKLKGGEYVAIEAMETAFAASPYATALMVVANGDLDSPLAVVCTTNEALEKWANDARIEFSTVHDLAKNSKARQEVVRSFVAAGQEAGLGKLELRIKDCVLITDTQWLPGHGMTASMKLDRHKIMEIHEKELKEMSSKLDAANNEMGSFSSQLESLQNQYESRGGDGHVMVDDGNVGEEEKYYEDDEDDVSLQDLLAEAVLDSDDYLRSQIVVLAQALERSELQRADALERIFSERKTNADSLRQLGESVKRFYSTVK